MLRKYSDFKSELLILESSVVYSNKFKKALSKIDNPIAKKLLEIENKDLDTQSNFFDIPIDKNDSVTFIPDRRAQEILGDKKELVTFTGRKGGWLTNNVEQNHKLFDALGYTPKSDKVYNPNEKAAVDEDGDEDGDGDQLFHGGYAGSKAEIGEVIARTVSTKSGKTFVYVRFPKGEGVYNQDKIRAYGEDKTKLVWSKNRQEIRTGRAVRALLTIAGEEVVDKDIEIFVNSFKAVVDIMNDKFNYFEVIRGEKIGHWYHQRNYKERKGSLGSSCMAAGPPKWFDIYMSNPDTVGLLILHDEDNQNKITGRAILWKLDSGEMFLDRIYTIKDSDVKLFVEYAKSKGWHTRSSNGYCAENSADGKKVELITHVKPGKYKGYPYMDTFRHWDPKTGKLSAESFKGYQYLGDTDGGLEDDECEFCFGEGEIECPTCGGEGEITCKCKGGKRKCTKCKKGKVDCPDCGGTHETKKGKPCTACDEDGKVDCANCGGTNEVVCKKCGGKGGIIPCKKCNGEGIIECPHCQ